MAEHDLDFVKKILIAATDVLCDNLDPSDMLRTLKTKDALKPSDVTTIRSKTTTEEQVETLLDILQRKPVSSYDVFMGVLQKEREDLYKKVKDIETKRIKHGGETSSEGAPPSADQVKPQSGAEELSSPGASQTTKKLTRQPSVRPEPDCNGSYERLAVDVAPEPSNYHRNPEKCYTSLLSSSTKGRAYILNVNQFMSRHQTRRGSLVDFRNMKHLFRELGYDISEHADLSAKEIVTSIEKFASQFNSAHASSVVVLMSHGDGGIVFGKDGNYVKLETIVDIFRPRNCPALKGKPKLFFIQACRGDVIERPVEADTSSIFDDENEDVTNNADIFVAFATTEGFYSLRHQRDGSWFVQAIMESFLGGAHMESLHQLMNQVTNLVTQNKGKLYDHETKTVKSVTQTPQIKHSLRKDVYFHPKYPAE